LGIIFKAKNKLLLPCTRVPQCPDLMIFVVATITFVIVYIVEIKNLASLAPSWRPLRLKKISNHFIFSPFCLDAKRLQKNQGRASVFVRFLRALSAFG